MAVDSQFGGGLKPFRSFSQKVLFFLTPPPNSTRGFRGVLLSVVFVPRQTPQPKRQGKGKSHGRATGRHGGAPLNSDAGPQTNKKNILSFYFFAL